MRSYDRLKIDYLERSRERMSELLGEIDRMGESVPLLENREAVEGCNHMIEELKENAIELDMKLSELGISNTDSWEWALEIEDAEWIFKFLTERIYRAKRVLKENNSKTIANKFGEKVETNKKG